MQATIRTHLVDGRKAPETSFAASPEEIADVPEEILRDTAQWCAGMARAMWLQANGDVDAMVAIDGTTVPDDADDLMDLLRQPPPDEG